MGNRSMIVRGRRSGWRLALLVTVACGALLPLAPVAAAPTAAGTDLEIEAFGAIAVDPTSGRVFVSGDDRIVVFDAAGARLSSIEQVYGARGLSFDAGYLWVTQTTSGSIAKINPATMKKVGEFATGGPVGDGIATVGGLVWFTSAGGSVGGLRALDPTTGAVSDRGDYLGSQLAEVPGSSNRLLVGPSVTLVNTSTTPVTVLGAGGSGQNFRQAAATEAGTLVSASGAPYRFDEYSLTPIAGELRRSGVSYPGTNYPNGITYSTSLGGVLAGTTQSTRFLYVWKRGTPLATHVLPLGGEPVPSGVALANDALRAYSVNSPTGYDGPLRLATIPLAPTLAQVAIGPITRGVGIRGTITGTGLGSITSATIGGAPVELAHDGPDSLVIDVATSVAAGTQPLVLVGPWGSLSASVTVVDNVGATLAGRVTRAGAPVPGVAVTLDGESGSRATTTADDGTYRFTALPQGRHDDLVFTDPATGDSVPFADLDLRSGAPWTYDLDLSAPPARTLQRRSLELPAGPVRRLVVDPATGRTFVAVGDEVVAFDRDGRQLRRIKSQWTASDLQVVGTKLYAMLWRAGAVSEIDTSTLSVLRTLPLKRATTGALAVTGNRLRFVDGDDQWTGLAWLDLTTGAVTDSAVGSFYTPRLGPVDGAPTHFLSWEVGISSSGVTHWDGSNSTPASLATSGFSVYGYDPGDFVASTSADKAWGADGRELSLATMSVTGTTYATGGGASAVARSAAHGGVLVFGARVSRQGIPVSSHVLPANAAPRSVGIDAAGDRTFTATDDGRLVVADLSPVVNSIAPTPVVEVPANVSVAGAGLGAATSVEVDGEPVDFSVPDAGHVNVRLDSVSDGAHVLTVVTPWGTTTPRSFEVDAHQGPAATSVSKTSGSALGGEVVRLTGSALDGATGVSFGGRTAPAFTIVSSTALDVTVPAHPAGEVRIAISSADHDPSTGPAYRYLDPTGGPTPSKEVDGGVGATSRPVSGDFTGDGVDDVLLYRPGAPSDQLRSYAGDGTFASSTLAVGGDYRPISGDFTGDGVDDIFWYAPGSAADSLWDFNPGGGHANVTIGVSGQYVPVSGDFTGDGVDDIFWYAPGSAADSLWDFNPGGGRTTTARTVTGSFVPVSGDFTGDDVDDVLWYGSAGAADRLWDFPSGGSYTSSTLTIDGTFTPVSGDFTGDDVDDVLWYGPASAADRLWDFNVGGTKVSKVIDAPMVATPLAADLTGGGIDDVFWHAAAPSHDLTWFFSPVVS